MDGSNEYYREVVIASVLHDIGKLFQRCRDKRYESGNEIEESLYCPYRKEGNYFGYRHVLSTYGFIHEQKGIFPNGINGEKIAELAAKHHLPDSYLETIIQQADWISAGHDRFFEEDENVPRKTDYYEQPLKSIFSSVSVFNKKNPQASYYKLAQLGSGEEGFPDMNFEKLGPEDYKRVADDFQISFARLRGLPYNQFLHSLNSLLKQFTWAIPASTNTKPDISLYDHVVTTAAFASVLFRYHEQTGSLADSKAVIDRNEKKFLLVSGDISGIQQYIFNLKSTTFNAKLLRARSLELQLLCESVSMMILNSLGLPLFCKLMDAGGRFIVVLPNTEYTHSVLTDTRTQIETSFLERYMGELSINVSDPVPVSSMDLEHTKTKDIFHKVAVAAAEAKSRKLQQALNATGHVLDRNYQAIEGSENVCPICEVRPVESVLASNDEEYHFCGICAALIKLGGVIPKKHYFIFSKNGNFESESSSDFRLPVGGTVSLVDRVHPDSIGEDDTVYTTKPAEEEIFGNMSLPFYLPRGENDGDILTFEQIAAAGQGSKKLAMMKADVDNLGSIFSHGLGNSLSISRYSTLSRMMNHFFSSYLNRRITEKWNMVYTVFAGGDDLCVIGPWQEIISFAVDIRKQFSVFTGHNPSITFSAGVVLSAPQLPVRYMARNSELLLDKAKEAENKDHVSLFGISVGWDEFEALIAMGEDCLRFIEEEKITKGFVYRLLQYARDERMVRQGNVHKEHTLWRSHFYYDIARNGKNLECKEKEDLITAIEKNITSLEIPVQYALYSLRD
jgi:CRISPR-associated protein Csm1